MQIFSLDLAIRNLVECPSSLMRNAFRGRHCWLFYFCTLLHFYWTPICNMYSTLNWTWANLEQVNFESQNTCPFHGNMILSDCLYSWSGDYSGTQSLDTTARPGLRKKKLGKHNEGMTRSGIITASLYSFSDINIMFVPSSHSHHMGWRARAMARV